MFERGATAADVARALGVTAQSAGRWRRRFEQGGPDALRSTGRRGRKARLTDGDLHRVERVLLKGPRANGFPTELWTLDRVAAVIERVTGVTYHRGHVWKVLQSLGWSLQRPARRATERDQTAIERWKKDRWPKVKKAPGAERPG